MFFRVEDAAQHNEAVPKGFQKDSYPPEASQGASIGNPGNLMDLVFSDHDYGMRIAPSLLHILHTSIIFNW